MVRREVRRTSREEGMRRDGEWECRPACCVWLALQGGCGLSVEYKDELSARSFAVGDAWPWAWIRLACYRVN